MQTVLDRKSLQQELGGISALQSERSALIRKKAKLEGEILAGRMPTNAVWPIDSELAALNNRIGRHDQIVLELVNSAPEALKMERRELLEDRAEHSREIERLRKELQQRDEVIARDSAAIENNGGWPPERIHTAEKSLGRERAERDRLRDKLREKEALVEQVNHELEEQRARMINA
ncbi:MAG: hypothetical protein K1X71_08145 [Pirellulales bacterium]|nr:hypothetical protein [Pirellulales bacterium]